MANFVHEDSTNSSTSSRKMDSNVNGLFKKKNDLSNNSSLDQKTNRFLIGKRKIGIKPILSLVILFLLIVGGVSAFILSQTSQDVRQQASGCVYWNGEAAVEGAFDNRGGIRQQCINGLWSRPDDGNTDPSQIIAEQKEKDAAKPKAGCMNWSGEMVSHGSYDNRGGIRQQCVNGIWDTPDDGNTDPSEIIAQNKKADEGTCVMWDTGATVGPGTCDDRNGLLQVCRNGLWDAPKGNDCKSPFQSVEDETHKVECQLGDTTVYATSEGVCEGAGNLIEKTEQLVGGIVAVVDSVKDAIENGFPSTFSSVETSTHNIECNLAGTITFVADESVCTAADGLLGGENTPTLNLIATEDNSYECIVGDEVFFTDSEETCEDSQGSASEGGCTPNSCILNVSAGQNYWCGNNGIQTRISCDTGRACGGIPEYSCNSSGQKCIGGRLVADQGCTSDDRFITLQECEVNNALAAVNFVGECRIGDHGYEFVEVNPTVTATIELDRYVPRGVCIQENREVIDAGFGDCVRGDNGWEFVVNSEAIQAAFLELSVRVTQTETDQCPWWNPVCHISSLLGLIDQKDNSDTEPEMVTIDCSYINQSTGECYDYTINVQPGLRCNDGPLAGSQGTQDGSCPEIRQNQSAVIPPVDIDDNQVSMVTCHQVVSLVCTEEQFEGRCPPGYLDGVCDPRMETCSFRNGNDCIERELQLFAGETCFQRQWRVRSGDDSVVYTAVDGC